MVIKTQNDLFDAIESKSASHEMRQKAMLLHEAIRDWPTCNLTRIDNFLTEFKNFFGSPVTVNLISDKRPSFEDDDVWKFESGSSIAELISYSKKLNSVDDLEIIISGMIKYYKTIEATPSYRDNS